MKTYTKEILILLLGLLGAMPMLNGQITVKPKKTTTIVTIIQKNHDVNSEKIIKEYAEKLTNWGDSLIPNTQNKPMPLSPFMNNFDFLVTYKIINDTLKFNILATEIDSRIQFKYIEPDTIEPEKTHGKRPRLAKLRNRHKIKKVVTYSHFDLGFLQVRAQKPIPNGTIPPPTVDFHQLPELDNFRTLQIGFEKDWGYNISKGKLRFWVGISYNIQNYRFKDNRVRLKHNAPQFEYELAPPAQNPNDNADKSKIVTNYLGIPISIGYQNKPRNPTFSAKFGIQGGYLVRCHSKVRTVEGEKIKYFDDFNMNDFAVHPFASIKLKNIEFYTKYGLTDIFKPHQGTPSHNFSFGIILATAID